MATGYPITDQEIQLMDDAEAEKAFREHFTAPTPDRIAAIAAIKDAVRNLEDARINVRCAAAQTTNTTTGNKLELTAAEIQDEIRYIGRILEELEGSK